MITLRSINNHPSDSIYRLVYIRWWMNSDFYVINQVIAPAGMKKIFDIDSNFLNINQITNLQTVT